MRGKFDFDISKIVLLLLCIFVAWFLIVQRLNTINESKNVETEEQEEYTVSALEDLDPYTTNNIRNRELYSTRPYEPEVHEILSEEEIIEDTIDEIGLEEDTGEVSASSAESTSANLLRDNEILITYSDGSVSTVNLYDREARRNLALSIYPELLEINGNTNGYTFYGEEIEDQLINTLNEVNHDFIVYPVEFNINSQIVQGTFDNLSDFMIEPISSMNTTIESRKLGIRRTTESIFPDISMEESFINPDSLMTSLESGGVYIDLHGYLLLCTQNIEYEIPCYRIGTFDTSTKVLSSVGPGLIPFSCDFNS